MESARGHPVAYVALFNPSPRNNLGTLIRCASAFGVEELVIVGVSKWSTHGAHGSQKACAIISKPEQPQEQSMCCISVLNFPGMVFKSYSVGVTNARNVQFVMCQGVPLESANVPSHGMNF